MKRLIDFFADKKVLQILDVGTGTGDFLIVLQTVFPEAAITGVDPSVESLATSREKYPTVKFTEMVAEELHFANNGFDVVSISMALHHLPDMQSAFKEMLRVLKPGGWIIVNELFSDNLNTAQEVHKMFHHFRSRIDRLLGINHNETFTKELILKIISDAGINIQFYFDDKKETNLIAISGELEDKIEKMKQHLEQIKHLPEFEILKPQIEEFRQKALKYGFQPATRVVVVGTVK